MPDNFKTIDLFLTKEVLRPPKNGDPDGISPTA